MAVYVRIAWVQRARMRVIKFVRAFCGGRGETGGLPGTLGILARGAQSEQSRQERQRGVLDGGREAATGGALATLGGTGGGL
jgi:hypothetical protein